MGVQPSAESHFRVGGMDVVRKKQKTPLELSLAGLFSDSNRKSTAYPIVLYEKFYYICTNRIV